MAWSVAIAVVTLVAGAHPYVEEGARAYDAQSYEAAVARLRLAAEVPDLTKADRRLTFELLARCHLALGEPEAAEEAFARLLQRDPAAPVPEGAPKLKEAYHHAKRRLYEPRFVRLQALTAPAGQLLADIIDPWALVREVRLWESLNGRMVAKALQVDGSRISERLSEATQAYYLQALDDTAQVLATLGTAQSPLEVRRASDGPSAVSVGPRRPRALTWVAATVTAASLVATVALAIASSLSWQAAGQASFASERKALDDTAQGTAIAAYALGGVTLAGLAGTLVIAWAP